MRATAGELCASHCGANLKCKAHRMRLIVFGGAAAMAARAERLKRLAEPKLAAALQLPARGATAGVSTSTQPPDGACSRCSAPTEAEQLFCGSCGTVQHAPSTLGSHFRLLDMFARAPVPALPSHLHHYLIDTQSVEQASQVRHQPPPAGRPLQAPSVPGPPRPLLHRF